MKKCLFIAIAVSLIGVAILALCTCGIFALFVENEKNNSELVPEMDCSQFVNLTDVIPDAILEIRYYGTYNFVGSRIDGYLEPTALLTNQAADSLRKVSEDLLKNGYRLKIYDAYRPQMSVDHFVRWSHQSADTLMKRYFYPMLDKPTLFEQDYIMAKSGHTRGSTVDVTLFDMVTEKEVDMGGTFDWFGVESHPDYCGNPETGEYDATAVPAGAILPAITEQQFENRMTLRHAMLSHGFKPLDPESVTYGINILDHSAEPMQQSIIVVRQLLQYVQTLFGTYQQQGEN